MSRRLRIAYLLPGFSAHEGDYAIPVQEQLVRQLAQHHDVTVFATRYPFHRKPYSVYGVPVIPLGWKQASGVARASLSNDLARELGVIHRTRGHFDVIHGTWGDETGLMSAYLGTWLRVPSVVSFVGGELVGFRELHYGLQNGMLSRWMVRYACRADRLIAISRYQADLLRTFAKHTQNIRVIPFGVDTTQFTPAETPPQHPRLIHAASLTPIKDQPMLIRALGKIRDLAWTLDIFGAGDMQRDLEAEIAALNMTDRITFHGEVDYAEMPAHFRAASLNLLTSRHEAQAMVTLEAAACGLATLGTRVGVLAHDPALGIAVETGDDQAFAAHLRDLLSAPSYLREIGLQARSRVMEAYTLAGTVDALNAVYDELTA
jgi:glycosyltransferase involved in cell wall biosynthesis